MSFPHLCYQKKYAGKTKVNSDLSVGKYFLNSKNYSNNNNNNKAITAFY